MPPAAVALERQRDRMRMSVWEELLYRAGGTWHHRGKQRSRDRHIIKSTVKKETGRQIIEHENVPW